MERLQVRNFGPIESIDIEIKDINIFIGKTSSGKSTVAKLITIFKNIEFIRVANTKSFKKQLKDFNIDFELKKSTFIKYSNDKVLFELKGEYLEVNNPLIEVLLKYDAIFSPFDSSLYDEKERNILLFLSTLIINPDMAIKAEDNENLQHLAGIIRDLEEMRGEASLEIAEGGLDPGTTAVLNDLLTLLVRELEIYHPLYIPAERILLSMVAESLFGLLRNDVAIATSIKDFGAKFERARNNIKKSIIGFLGIQFEYEDSVNLIRLPDNTRIRLEHTSSGYQSVTPLFLVLEYFLNNRNFIRNCIVVEEPESNLYPTAQKDLIEYVVEGKLKSEDKLIITTHSPYVLTTLDNLIQAYNVAVREGKSSEEVEKIIPRKFWIDFDKVTCYYFENGSCRSTLDSETMTIGASNIDDVSIQLGKTFDELISLKYN